MYSDKIFRKTDMKELMEKSNAQNKEPFEPEKFLSPS